MASPPNMLARPRRLAQTHLAIGSALGGEAGARLAEKTAVPTSPDTLLRRVKQAGARSSRNPAIRRHRRLGLVQGAALRHHRRRPRDERRHRPPARPRRRDRQDLARGPSRHRAGQPRPLVVLLPGGHRGRVPGPAGRRSMAPAEERARGHRTPAGASSAGHHGGPQARRSRSDNDGGRIARRRARGRDDHRASSPGIAVGPDSGLTSTGSRAGQATAARRAVRAGP